MKRGNEVSLRLPNWDYSWAGVYFITTCTKFRNRYFGEVKNGTMNLSNVGVIADVMWQEIIHHRQNMEVGPFIVMPNHIHGIIIIKNDADAVIDYSARKDIVIQRFQNQGKNSVSSIIGGYKAAVSKHAHRLGYEMAWQPGFYDEIVRDAVSYQNIVNYIANNPKNWNEDDYYLEELNGYNARETTQDR